MKFPAKVIFACFVFVMLAAPPPSVAETQGATANRQGRMLETTIRHILETKGFTPVSYTRWLKAPEKFGGELLLTNAPFRTIYGHQGRTEFLLQSERLGLKIRIEAKWQQVKGSTDEKLAYLYLNAIEAMPEQHVIIVIDGDGWRRQALAWLRQAAAAKAYTTPANDGKTVQVLSLAEFIAWANRTFR